MLSVGVDITDIVRIERAIERWQGRFLQRIYTAEELAYCRKRLPELAARFAAKEAISKALGTGIVGVAWREMEVVADNRGKPIVRLHGNALERARALELNEWAVSLSHTDTQAIAMVVATG